MWFCVLICAKSLSKTNVYTTTISKGDDYALRDYVAEAKVVGMPEDPAAVLSAHLATTKATSPPVIYPLPVQAAAAGGGVGAGRLVASPLAHEQTLAMKKQISEYSNRPQDAMYTNHFGGDWRSHGVIDY